MNPQQFTELLEQFPQVVNVVTVGRGGVESGLTVSWATPVSFSPPQILISVDAQHHSLDLLRSTESFVLNILPESRKDLAARFARQSFANENKLDGLAVEPSETGAPILQDALAHLDCEISNRLNVGDHVLLVGKVVGGGILSEAAPLTTGTALRYLKSAGKKPTVTVSKPEPPPTARP